jgi:AcrR family transcriptional regulator
MQCVTERATTTLPGPGALDPATSRAVESLRERKKLKTRRALEAAALDLFAKQGFERTTVEQIADACDVSPRTFFRYFATKEDVLFSDSQQKLEILAAALEGRPADEPPLRSLRAASLTLVSSYSDEREQRQRRADIVAATPSLRSHGSEHQDEWHNTALEILTRRHTGDPTARPPLDVRLAVAASMAAIRAAVAAWLADDEADLETLVEHAFDRLAHGLDS